MTKKTEKLMTWLDSVEARYVRFGYTAFDMQMLTNLRDIVLGSEKLDSWTPTAANIESLPEPIRKYIADMQTNADPPGMIAENALLADAVRALQNRIKELETSRTDEQEDMPHPESGDPLVIFPGTK
jgi:hypothetical protein